MFPKNRGTPKWMVYNGKPQLKWMIWWENPLFSETSIYPRSHLCSNPRPQKSLISLCLGEQGFFVDPRDFLVHPPLNTYELLILLLIFPRENEKLMKGSLQKLRGHGNSWCLYFLVVEFRWALKQTCQILRGSFHLHVEFLGRFGWLYIIQLSMIQSSIYSKVSLWPNLSYSSNSKNILLRTFVWWFITFRTNPKCIEESIPDSETSDILLIKGVCKNWPRQKGFRWKGNIPVLLFGSQIGHQALLRVGGHPYGAGEVLGLCGIGHWEIEDSPACHINRRMFWNTPCLWIICTRETQSCSKKKLGTKVVF